MIAAEAQTVSVNISVSKATVGNIIEMLHEQTGYEFSYDAGLLSEKISDISVKMKNEEIEDVLSSIFSNTNVSFKVINNRVFLKNEKRDGTAKSVSTTQQQVKTITGTVVDKQGETVIGATIVVKGDASKGTVTDFDGNFTLNNIPNDATIEVSYVGMSTILVNTQGKISINIVMEEDNELLEELVVVGYGTMRKRDMTGSVSSIKMSEQPVSTISSISHALAGKAAGLQVNTVSAQPGGGASYRIRGAGSVSASNSPLIVIDGFPITDPGSLSTGKYESGTTDNILASINPNDIESIEVLKDASSTAIYGSRAANGVILITTKKGASGVPKVSYSGSATVQAMGKKYETLNAHDFMTESNKYAKEEWLRVNKMAPYGTNTSANRPFNPRYTDDQIANPINDTNWLDAITRTAFQTQHNISISGGNDHTKYLVSGNYFTQEGIVKNNNINRFTGRSNIEHKLSKYITAGTNITFSRNNYDNVPLGSGQNENASIMVAAAQFNPLIPVKDAEGKYPLNTEAAYLPNPASLLEITDNTISERFLGSAFVEVEPIKDLKLKANLGIDRNYQKRKVYLPTTTLYGAKENGKANIAQQDRNDYLFEVTANYNYCCPVKLFCQCKN